MNESGSPHGNTDIDDLAVEQNRFQYYQRNVQRQEAAKAAFLQKRVRYCLVLLCCVLLCFVCDG